MQILCYLLFWKRKWHITTDSNYILTAVKHYSRTKINTTHWCKSRVYYCTSHTGHLVTSYSIWQYSDNRITIRQQGQKRTIENGSINIDWANSGWIKMVRGWVNGNWFPYNTDQTNIWTDNGSKHPGDDSITMRSTEKKNCPEQRKGWTHQCTDRKYYLTGETMRAINR